MALTARSAKRKGTRLEKLVDAELRSLGLQSRRQPGSGIYEDFKHDNWVHIPGYGDCILECKARKEGHRTLDKWLGIADILVIKADRNPPNVYMPWKTFKGLIDAINSSACDADGCQSAGSDPAQRD